MLARSGCDPLSEKRRVQGVPTFAEAARRVLEQKRRGWRGRWHAHNWWRSLERYVFKVKAAYARSDLFERRRRLMNDWAEHLAGKGR